MAKEIDKDLLTTVRVYDLHRVLGNIFTGSTDSFPGDNEVAEAASRLRKAVDCAIDGTQIELEKLRHFEIFYDHANYALKFISKLFGMTMEEAQSMLDDDLFRISFPESKLPEFVILAEQEPYRSKLVFQEVE